MNIKKQIESTLNTLSSVIERRLFDLENMEYCESGYKVGNEPPRDGWKPYTPSTALVGGDKHYWIKASFKTPKLSENEYFVLRATTGREGMDVAANPQGLLYLNGKMSQGLDSRHTDAYLDADTEYSAYNYLYVGDKALFISYNMSVYAINECVEKLYYDIKAPYDTLLLLSEYSDEYHKIISVLSDAIRLLDMRDLNSREFFESAVAAGEYLSENFYGKLCSTEGKPTVSCVGHTHIDVEWLWARAQTREKIQRSFSTAKALMDKYPEYKFMLSQPELYRYLKEEAPEKYAELKALVAEGRWEPEGSMYLEPDCNLTSGESLIRQIMHGKRFFREEFRKECKILFLPDVFGYSAALPQILKKSGVDYFVTAKIGWNDTNKMPHDTFYWEGIDGTEIFTSFITTQEYVRDENQKRRYTTYVGNIIASRVKGTWDRFGEKEYASTALMTYGYGDGGGGPTKEMLEYQRRFEKGIPGMPTTKLTTLTEHLAAHKAEFDESTERKGRVPRWVGELYLEYHRGTYTSIAKIKKNNRRAEYLLGNIESLSAVGDYLGKSYDKNGLDKLWRKVLHNQFHDILPGSSIGAVYDNTDADYALIQKTGGDMIAEKLDFIAENVNTDGGVLLYNPTGFSRRAVSTGSGAYNELSEFVAPYGWKVVKADLPASRVGVSGLRAENDFYIITLNERGEMASLYDKRAEREVFKPGASGKVLSVFFDNPTNYDAWELEDYYKLSRKTIDGAAKITPIVDGTRAGFVIERDYMNSRIKETVWLYTESARIDIECEIDWHEHHQILKTEFPIDVHASTATYGVQFGHVVRPTHANTSWDEAKFEVSAQKWADISENGYGVALLNDSKYGYSAEGSNLSLTLLKCATYPYADADQGNHRFTYSLLPHIDGFREGGVIEEAELLNQPMFERKVGKLCGTLPAEFSLVSVDKKNAHITAVKPAESGDGLVVRFYEAYDRREKVTVTVPKDYTAAFVCDLMENELSPLDIKDGKVALPLSNFEIVTLKFKK